MNELEKQTLQFVMELQKLFFTDKDIQEVLKRIDEDLVWLNIHNEPLRGYKLAENKLLHPTEFEIPSFTTTQSRYEVRALSETLCAVYGCLPLIERGDGARSPLQLGVSLTVRKTGDSMKLCGFHISLPQTARAGGGSCQTLESMGNEELKRLISAQSMLLREKNRDLQALTDNIPGGVFCCENDEALTFLKISDGFLSMFGYTKEEIAAQFDNSFLRMVYPEDRALFEREFNRQLPQGGTQKIEHRVRCRDGRVIWVIEKGRLSRDGQGKESMYCVVLDVTAEKDTREELRQALERHRLIMSHTSDIVFEWNPHNDTLTFSKNFTKLFGYAPLSEHISGELPRFAQVHPDDRAAFSRLIAQVGENVPYCEAELRLQDALNQYIWCRIRVSMQFTALNEPLKAIGILQNIDAEKQQTKNLQERAERDSLTGLYNRMTTQTMVETYLNTCRKNEQGALLIIDVDDFKQVNDSWGHLFGDAVLSEISSEMKKLFRSSDIIGRVGGDEFVVFLKDISDSRFALKKAKRIIGLFQEICEAQKRDYRISCSIGVSLYPCDGDNFQELYHHADIALYRAKRDGKNQCTLYQPEMLQKPFGSGMADASSVNETIDSNSSGAGAFSNRVAEYVFRALYQSQDLQAAVGLVLEIVGQQFDVSRAYIFENTEDGQYMCNTFEWCNRGVRPEIENLKCVPYAEIGNYQDNFDENGIFYCRDIKELPDEQYGILANQDIQSMLQCAIWDKGKFHGFVGFDDCDIHRLWTQEQIDALVLISEMLSVFLLKERAQEKTERAANQMKTVLDNQNLWIYAIDKETYELLYINRQTQQLVPSARTGTPCYKAFFGRDFPCEKCPARQSHHGHNCTMEIYNPLLKVWTKADACSIIWDGREARLLSCCDITEYKEPVETKELS